MWRDRRGATSFETVLVFLGWLLFLFTIFDLGRFAVVEYSLRKLASAGARQMMINCYTPKIVTNGSPGTCTGDPLSDPDKQSIAPFLYIGGLTPTLNVSAGSNVLTVTASEVGFTMLMPLLWGNALNAPSAKTWVPY